MYLNRQEEKWGIRLGFFGANFLKTVRLHLKDLNFAPQKGKRYYGIRI
jgi:hypothetical protein